LGRMLRDAARQEKYTAIVDIIRQLALTGCRRSEMIGLKWTEADTESSCLRLEDSKEGESNRENLAHPTRGTACHRKPLYLSNNLNACRSD
jgi:integrase